MIDKLVEVIGAVRGAVFGWRKLGVLVGVLATVFVWLFLNTLKTETGVVVPDLPPMFAGTVVTLYLTFVIGNWGVHKIKNGSDKPEDK